jgi:DNA-binding response OmpR family regulator
MKKHILIVEDESDIASALAARLKNEGFAVSVADNGDDGLDLALSEDYDLALLDIMLPGKDGLEIASALREKKDTAILVLSARDEENDIISGLDIGADDYVTKPFSLREVVARVHALMRRRDASRLTRFTATDELTFGDLYIDGRAHLVKLNSKIVHVTPTEFRLLYTLCSNPSNVFTREELVSYLTHQENNDEIATHANLRTVDSHVRSLRKKIGNEYIRTIHAVGYSFEPSHVSAKASA